VCICRMRYPSDSITAIYTTADNTRANNEKTVNNAVSNNISTK
jgi:hypothetical protein